MWFPISILLACTLILVGIILLMLKILQEGVLAGANSLADAK